MKKFFACALAVLAFTSCSTIINGTKQTFKIKSNHKIQVIDKYGQLVGEGNGNLEISLPKSDSVFLPTNYIIKSGEKEFYITPRLNIGAYLIGNLFTFGIGTIVDDFTGAKYDLYVNGIYTDNIVF